MVHLVFLVCAERSGGNVLASLLSSHSCITNPPPTHLFRLVGTGKRGKGSLEDNGNWDQLVEQILRHLDRVPGLWNSTANAGELKKKARRRTAAELLRIIYEKEAGEEGASHILVRENETWSFAPFLLAHFPDSRFLVLVRDPRDVAAAGMKAGSGKLESLVDAWLADMGPTEVLRQQLEGSGKMLFLRYEDLAGETEKTLLEITAFLGLLYEERMMPAEQLPQTEKNGDRIHARVTLNHPLTRRTVGKYRQTLSEQAVRYVESRCREFMEAFGYVPDPATGPLPEVGSKESEAELSRDTRARNPL